MSRSKKIKQFVPLAKRHRRPRIKQEEPVEVPVQPVTICSGGHTYMKLTEEQLQKELIASYGSVPENLSVGPEGKCPVCAKVQYTGAPLCVKHLEESRKWNH